MPDDLTHKLQAIINHAIDGIITIDHRGIMETVNPAAALLFGYSEVELLGHNVSMLMPNPHKENHDGYLRNYQHTGRAKIIGKGREVMGVRKDGTQFPFKLSVSEVKLENRTVYAGIIHDLSAIRQVENELRQLNIRLEQIVEERTEELETVINRLLSTNHKLKKREEELEQALQREKELNDLKGRFVSIASHEFRTPLASILSSTSLIQRYTQAEQQKNRDKHISRIKNSVNHLTSILNDFLSLSKIEEGAVQVHIQTINVYNLLKSIASELQGIKNPSQSLLIECETTLEMQSDLQILKNTLLNLLSNAIKYSPPSSEIRCSVAASSDTVTFAIHDHGIGIPQEEQKHLFSRFFRASNATHIQGTGLGLSIVKRYLRLLRGRIWLESEPGQGSSFYFELPLNHTS